MRYAIFSDVHANLQAWEAVRADARRQGVDTLICLGDVVGYGPKPLEVLTSVRESTPNFVLGNHDAAACGRLDASIFNPQARSVIEWTCERLDDDAREFLNRVPLQMNGEGIQLVHAEVTNPGEFGYVNGPGPAESNLRAMTQPLAFIGHTHLPLAYTMPKKGGQVMQLPPIEFQVERGKRTLVNVGSVGEPRSTDVRASYVIYDDTERKVTFRKVTFDVEGYRKDLEDVGLQIRPYFVEVVEAGMAAGTPAPAAARELAMAQLPKVAQEVTGNHGHLVLGSAGDAAARGSEAGTPAPVKNPTFALKEAKIMPVGIIALLVALIAVSVGGLAIVAKRQGSRKASAIKQTAKTKPEKAPKTDTEVQDPAPTPVPTPVPTTTAIASNPAPPPPEIQIPTVKPLEPPPEPRPAPNTTPADRLSQDLLSYWSFDRKRGTDSRFEQQPDGSVLEILIHEKDQLVQAHVPKRDIGTQWRDLDFDADRWIHGQNGVGYEDKPAEYENLIQTMAGGATRKQPHSIYIRIPFKIDDPSAYAGLALYMKYDDGFTAFLNGRPMASKNAPKPLLWNSGSTDQHADTEAVVAELFKANPHLADLKEGWNLLAIHGLNGSGEPNATNTGSTSSDMLILPTLVALRKDNTLPEAVGKEMRNVRDRSVSPDRIKGEVTPTTGQFRDAYEFKDGSIEIGDPGKYSIRDRSFSVSLWFSRDLKSVDKQARHLISAGAGDVEGSGWSLAMNRAVDTLRLELSDGLDRSTIGAKVGNLANGQWRHVVASIDRPSGTVHLYLDGKPVADRHIDFVGRSTITSKSGLAIGRDSDDKQRHRGKLDDVAIWRRTLAPEEVTRIFNSGKSLGSIFGAEAAE